MRPRSRVKISVSLPMDLVARIDRTARGESRSRSRVLESWLRSAAHKGARREVEEATIAYYESLTPEEQREDATLAAGQSGAAGRVAIDEPTPRRPPRRRKQR